MLNAIIVDDEIHSCKTLEALLKRDCPQVNLVALCSNGEEAIRMIKQSNPDVVFLDVEMPRMNGFEMLERLPQINFHLIFVTSYDAYALKAIRFSAIDYLLKPINRDELKAAVEKVTNRMQVPLPEQLKIILEKMQHPVASTDRIALPTLEGLQMLPIDSIISCEADDNYTTLHLKGNKKIVVSSTLKVIEELLEDHQFLRVHRSYLVSLNKINSVEKNTVMIANQSSSILLQLFK